eukprot:590575-Rhodomonas_salina.2
MCGTVCTGLEWNAFDLGASLPSFCAAFWNTHSSYVYWHHTLGQYRTCHSHGRHLRLGSRVSSLGFRV